MVCLRDVGCGVVEKQKQTQKRLPGHVYALLKAQNPAEVPLPKGWSLAQKVQLVPCDFSCSRNAFLNQKPLNAAPVLEGAGFQSFHFINLDNPFMIRRHLFPKRPGERVPTRHHPTSFYASLLQLKIILPLPVIIFMSPLSRASGSRHHKPSLCVLNVFMRYFSVWLENHADGRVKNLPQLHTEHFLLLLRWQNAEGWKMVIFDLELSVESM